MRPNNVGRKGVRAANCVSSGHGNTNNVTTSRRHAKHINTFYKIK